MGKDYNAWLQQIINETEELKRKNDFWRAEVAAQLESQARYGCAHAKLRATKQLHDQIKLHA